MNIWLPIILVLLMACARADTPPKDLIPQSEMIQILTDAIEVEAWVDLKRLPGTNEVMSYKKAYLEDVFEHHNVSEERFNTSYEFYSLDLQNFGVMYDSVLVELSKREALLKQN